MDDRKRDDVREEVSAFGERVRGTAKDAAGVMTGNRDLEREGEREKARGKARQAANSVLDDTDDMTGRPARSRAGYVTGLYRSPESAARAYQGLTNTHGYKTGDIDVLMSEETRRKHFADAEPGKELSSGTKAAEGFGKGSAIGGGVGAALAAAFAVGTSIIVPGLGLVVAGPIAAALMGAGAGGATGGVIGALIGAGIPEDRATAYDQGLQQGGIVLGTRARDDAHAADLQRDFKTYGGTDVYL